MIIARCPYCDKALYTEWVEVVYPPNGKTFHLHPECVADFWNWYNTQMR